MKNVLALPGGGIRGYVSARALVDIEMETGYRAGEVFDLVGGTSTGGILACAVGLGHPAQVIVDMYRERGPDIFHRSWWAKAANPLGLRAPRYSPDALRESLTDVFGDVEFGVLPVPTLVPARDFTARREKLFKSYGIEDAHLSIVDVCMATSAAPTYFPPHEIGGKLFIDGGLYANNPAAILSTEAAESYDEPFRVLVLHSGRDASMNKGDGSLGWGLIRWAPAVVAEFMDAGNDVSRYIARLIAHDRLVSIHPGHLELAMDDASDEAFEKMDRAYEAHMQEWVLRVSDTLASDMDA